MPGYRSRHQASNESSSHEIFANGDGDVHLPATNGVNGEQHSRKNGYVNGHSNGISRAQTNGERQITMNGNGHKSMPSKTRLLLPFSAHDDKTLQANYEALAKSITKWNLMDVAFTLSARRSLQTYRSFAITAADDLETSQRLPDYGLITKGKRSSGAPVLAFVFTGQGAQWPQMGQALMKEYPSFLATIRRLDRYLDDLDEAKIRDWSIEEVLNQGPEESVIHNAELSQPLVTALQIALVCLLSQWGVKAQGVVGHSSGEIAAAFAAGLLTEQEAIIAAYLRGAAVARNKKKGLMMAVGGSLSEIQGLVDEYHGDIVVACHNSPESYTLSGDADAMLRLKETLDEHKIFCRALSTNDNAYHSHHMTAIGPQYERDLEFLMRRGTTIKSLKQTSKGRPAQAVFFSSCYGHAAPWSLLGAKYWRQNLESPVLFHQAVAEMVTQLPIDILVEIGPHGALQGPIRQLSKTIDSKIKFPEYLTTIVRNGDNIENVLTLAGNLFNRGYDVDLARINAIESRGGDQYRLGKVVTDLPHYQWQYPKEVLLFENRWTREWRLRMHPRHDILGSRIPGSNKAEPTWRNKLSMNTIPWLTDHRVSNLSSIFLLSGLTSLMK